MGEVMLHQQSFFLPDGRPKHFDRVVTRILTEENIPIIGPAPPSLQPLGGRLQPGKNARHPPDPKPGKGKQILSDAALLRTKWNMEVYSAVLPGLIAFTDVDFGCEIGWWELVMEMKSHRDWWLKDGKEVGQSIFLRNRAKHSNGACKVWNVVGHPPTNTVEWFREVDSRGEWTDYQRATTKDILDMIRDWGRRAYAYPRWNLIEEVSVPLSRELSSVLGRQAYENDRPVGAEAAAILAASLGVRK